MYLGTSVRQLWYSSRTDYDRRAAVERRAAVREIVSSKPRPDQH